MVVTIGVPRPDPLAPAGPAVVGRPGAVPTGGRAVVDLGVYANDGRIVATALRWPELVDRAVATLPVLTGLTFPPTKRPRVRLAPLGDEHLDFAVATEIAEGRRLPVLTVNTEPLAPGRRDVEMVLLRGLAAAVFEDVTHRLGAPPPYVVRVAEIVASGDVNDHLERLRHDTGDSEPRVDPADSRAVEATALAAVIVLRESGGPDAVKRFLRFAAEGDDPDDLLVRAVQDPTGRWAGRGRARLAAHLASVDVRPWQLLARARRTVREEGRGAMESVLPQTLPPRIAPEVTVLRAQAFADEGDYESARRLLATLDGSGIVSIADPGRAAALRIRAERAEGGDALLADRLEADWRRDYPRLAARAEPTTPGGRTQDSDFVAVQTRVEALLAAHRAGAARRFLEGMGERALAPELAEVQRAVVAAESMPTAQAIEVSRRRVRTWLASRTEENAAAVRAGGAAGAVALAEVLPPRAGPGRREAVRLLGRTGGTGRAVELLGPVWARRASLLPGDLDALLAVAAWHELRVWVQGVAGDVPGGESVWAQLRYGVDVAWVRQNPQVLSDLRSDAYPVRRRAFETVAESGRATPALVAHGLRDPAPLMRRAATEVAGRESFPALIRIALRDDAWMVRQAACAAAVRGSGTEAPELLLRAFRCDTATQVRLAAAVALFELEAPGARVLQTLVQGLFDAVPGVRDLCAARLPGIDARRVVPIVLSMLEAEARLPRPRSSVLARLFLVLERSTNRKIGYVAGMSAEEVRTLLAEIRKWAQRGGR